MKIGIVLFAFVFAGCCTTDKCIAVTASNAMHDAGSVAADAIKLDCTAKYQAATTAAEIATIDTHCLPAASAYSDFVRAQTILETLLAAVIAGSENVSFSTALKNAQTAATVLAERINEVSK